MSSAPRNIVARETAEGAGARVKRAFPSYELRTLDPFVLLDEFFVVPPAGFPEHPHGGFEIVTYMLEGAFRHWDNLGNDRTIPVGGVQRITAGRGIRHSELPGTDGMNHGLQLWVNLPKRLKSIDPGYQEVLAEEMPQLRGEAWAARVIVGESSPTRLHTLVLYLDVRLEPGARFRRRLPEGWTVLVYVLEGELSQPEARPGILLTLEREVELGSVTAARFALIAGEPWREPIRLAGSFVE